MRIKEARELAGKMQKEVATDLGIALSTFSQYETGKREPDNATLIKIAQYLETTTDYLLENTDDPTPPNTKNDTSKEVSDDDIMFALFDGDKEITDEMYAEVKQFAQFVRAKKAKKNDNDATV